MFVRFSSRARVSVISAPGVIYLLGDDEKHMVSANEIARIRDGLASGCLLRPHPYLSAGMPVRVRSGVFEDVEGIVTELRNRCRVVIALSVAKQCFSLEMDLRDLEILSRSHDELK
jgi:transcription antitermination factor NusG